MFYKLVKKKQYLKQMKKTIQNIILNKTKFATLLLFISVFLIYLFPTH